MSDMTLIWDELAPVEGCDEEVLGCAGCGWSGVGEVGDGLVSGFPEGNVVFFLGFFVAFDEWVGVLSALGG